MSTKRLFHFERRYPRFNVFVVKLFSLFILLGCGQAEHVPRDGEYGQKLATSLRLEKSKIDLFNSDELPKNYLKQTEKELIKLKFEADTRHSPYRYVVVLRGKTEREGEVDIRFIGGVMPESKDGVSPVLLMEEDTHSYDKHEKVLLVLPSDPFSIDINSTDKNYILQLGLSKQENFIFEHAEVQIWQGKGEKYPMLSYLAFFCIVAGVLLLVYRFISGLEAS